MPRRNILCRSFVNFMQLFHLVAINFQLAHTSLACLGGRTFSISSEVKSVSKTRYKLNMYYSDYLRSLCFSLPFSNVFIKKLRLYLCGLLNGKHPWTILVLENKILLKLSPALLIGCSYIFIYLLININYINLQFNSLINNIKN